MTQLDDDFSADHGVAILDERIKAFLTDRSMSFWLQGALSSALDRDPLDVARDAEILAVILRNRLSACFSEHTGRRIRWRYDGNQPISSRPEAIREFAVVLASTALSRTAAGRQRRLAESFYDHLSRAIYAEACDWRPASFGELRRYFENERERYFKGAFLLIAILNDRLGTALTSTYEVLDAEHLDLDGFRFAGRIAICGWRDGEMRLVLPAGTDAVAGAMARCVLPVPAAPG